MRSRAPTFRRKDKPRFMSAERGKKFSSWGIDTIALTQDSIKKITICSLGTKKKRKARDRRKRCNPNEKSARGLIINNVIKVKTPMLNNAELLVINPKLRRHSDGIYIPVPYICGLTASQSKLIWFNNFKKLFME